MGAFGLVAAALVGALLVDRGDGPAPIPTPTVSPTPSAAPTATPSPTATLSHSPTPSPTLSPPLLTPSPTSTPTPSTLRLAVWSKAGSTWADSLAAAAYEEGDNVPFLLMMGDLQPGETYRVIIRYECRANGAAAFDFLSGTAEESAGQMATAEGGPGRARPDATIPLPDDPTIRFDDARPDASLRLWGGSFVSAPRSLSEGPCVSEKQFEVMILARQTIAYLMWAGHLASADDWGSGKGASSAGGLLTTGASVGPVSVGVALAASSVAP